MNTYFDPTINVTRVLFNDKDIKPALDILLERLVIESEQIEKNKPKPRAASPITEVVFNYKKGTTAVKWVDETWTVVRCTDEPFDEEKGIAMCFVKKFYENRSYFNEHLRAAIDGAKRIGIDLSYNEKAPKVEASKVETPKEAPRRRRRNPDTLKADNYSDYNSDDWRELWKEIEDEDK